MKERERKKEMLLIVLQELVVPWIDTWIWHLDFFLSAEGKNPPYLFEILPSAKTIVNYCLYQKGASLQA